LAAAGQIEKHWRQEEITRPLNIIRHNKPIVKTYRLRKQFRVNEKAWRSGVVDNLVD